MTTTKDQRYARYRRMKRQLKRDDQQPPEYRYCKDCFTALAVTGIYDENGKKVREYTQKHTKLECHRAQTESMLDQY